MGAGTSITIMTSISPSRSPLSRNRQPIIAQWQRERINSILAQRKGERDGDNILQMLSRKKNHVTPKLEDIGDESHSPSPPFLLGEWGGGGGKEEKERRLSALGEGGIKLGTRGMRRRNGGSYVFAACHSRNSHRFTATRNGRRIAAAAGAGAAAIAAAAAAAVTHCKAHTLMQSAECLAKKELFKNSGRKNICKS